MDDSELQNLTDEEIIEQLAGVGYGPREIALYLGTDVQYFLNQWKDPDSKIRKHYDRGILLVEASIATGMAQLATQDPAAAKQHLQINATRQFQTVKEKLLRGEL